MRFTSQLQPIISAKEMARMIIALRSIQENLALKPYPGPRSSSRRTRRRDWHRVVPAAPPRMAAANPPQRQPAAAQRAVSADGFERVGRTARGETAPPHWTQEDGLGRRQHPAIGPHGEHQDVLSWIHD